MRSNKDIATAQVATAPTYSRWQDLSMLVKTRLSMTVVFTSVMGYFISAGSAFEWNTVILLFIGGFLITASANALNEVLEKDFDALMKRTSIRPLASGRMKTSDAVLFSGISCLIGVSLLAFINPLSSLLGMLSFVLYAFVYTPLKRYSTIAVAIGAIPGALPVLIGCTAFHGAFTITAVTLFAIQFLWQFPHFWAIGYLAYDDYYRAGYKLLPADEDGGIDTNVGLYSLIYTLLIIPILLGTWLLGDISVLSMSLSILMTIIYGYYSFVFYKNMERKTGLALMFSSFFYMPIILFIFLWS